MAIRGVLLDSGGVITGLRPPKSSVFARACSDLGRPLPEELACRAFLAADQLYGVERELLFADPPEFTRHYQAILFQEAGLGSPDPAVLERYAALLQSKQFRSMHPDVVPTLEELKRDGYRLGLLSNAHSDLKKLLMAFDLWVYFDAHLISWEEKLEKPDPRFFRLALDRLGLEPAEAAHVGDDPLVDYEGSRRAGLHPILLDRGVRHGVPSGVRTIPDLFVLPEVIRSL